MLINNSKIVSIHNNKILTNVGIHCEKMPENIFSYLKDNINTKDFGPFNKGLAGNIRKEYDIYSLVNVELHNYLLGLAIKPMFHHYMEEAQILTEDRRFEVGNLWVNYMKKNEFNPVHYHDGLFSWNIIVKIPFDLEEELKKSPGINSYTNVPSCLCYLFTDPIGRIQTIYCGLTKEEEGHILFFPSKLRHCVNPFYTSDDYRITISGNIYLNPNKKVDH